MGEALASGLAYASFPPENVIVTARTQASLDRISNKFKGIATSLDNASAARHADLVIIAVKPWQIESVIKEIRPALDCGRCIIASVAAGVGFQEMAGWIEKDGQVPAMLRIIPNTAIALQKGVTFIASCGVPEEKYEEISGLFKKMGAVIRVDEKMLPAGTALASCGIAYALKYIDASIKGGGRLGFSEEEAKTIVMSTMEGAIALLTENGTTPQHEIDKVTTPGGYTFRGLTAMEENGFSEAVIQGLLHSM